MKNQTQKIVMALKSKEEYVPRKLSEAEWVSYGRKPMLVRPEFYARDPKLREKEKALIYEHKRAHKEAKKNKAAYLSAQEEIVRAFLKSHTPMWGEFRFQGIVIQ